METVFQKRGFLCVISKRSVESIEKWMVEGLLGSYSFSRIHPQHFLEKIKPKFINFAVVSSFDGFHGIDLGYWIYTSGNLIPTNFGFFRKNYLWVEIRGPRHFWIR